MAKGRVLAKRSDLANKSAFDRKLTYAAWALFFVAWGLSQWTEFSSGISLRNLQYLGIGLILLGLNLARYLNRIYMSRLTLTLGLIATFGGLYRLLSGDESLIPLIPIALLSPLVVEGLARWMGSAKG
ncbi:MAG TPA: hypothetical protein VHS06_08340 [Chloroflexota bacterium]|nr:hypothetical protein [Chloroflexota bacterium]